jgi:hypothetical protein
MIETDLAMMILGQCYTIYDLSVLNLGIKDLSYIVKMLLGRCCYSLSKLSTTAALSDAGNEMRIIDLNNSMESSKFCPTFKI